MSARESPLTLPPLCSLLSASPSTPKAAAAIDGGVLTSGHLGCASWQKWTRATALVRTRPPTPPPVDHGGRPLNSGEATVRQPLTPPLTEYLGCEVFSDENTLVAQWRCL